MSNTLSVSYANFKLATSSSAKYYLAADGGYRIISSVNGIVYETSILSSTDVSDFEANLKSSAVAVGSIDDAKFLANPSSSATQSVSGSLTANIGTTGGLALDATLTGGSQRTKITDGTNNAALANSNPAGTEQGLIVRNIPSGTQTVSAASLPLPSGAATETTLGTRLADSTFTGRINTFGQKTAANSTPVVLASDQSTLAVSAANLPLPTGAALDTTLTGGTQRTKITDGTNNAALASSSPAGTEQGLIVRNIPSGTQTVSGTITASQATAANLNATVVGSGSAGTPASGVITVQGISGGTAQPVSATSLPLPTGAATETTLGNVAKDATITARLGTLGQKTAANSTPVVLASDQSALSVSGTITANIGTSGSLALDATITGGSQRSKLTDGTNNVAVSSGPAGTECGLITRNIPYGTQTISATSLPLPSGASTESTLSALSGKFGSLGQKAMTGSAPVVISSDQSAIPVSGSITANVGTTNGLALDATLTGGTQVSKIGNGTITAQLLASTPAGTENALVVRNIPSGTQAVSAASLPLPTGASTEATLSALSGKFGSLGQKAMAGSTPIVIASDQSAIPITGSITATNASVGSTGSTVPTSATLLGGSDGSLFRAIKLASDGTQLIQGLGTAGTATGGILTIQGISGGTAVPCSVSGLPLPTGAATEATLISGSQRTKITDGTNNVAVLTADAVGTEAGLAVRQVGRSVMISESEYYLELSDHTGSGVCWGETTTNSTTMKLISTNTVGQLTTTGINTFTVVSSSSSDNTSGTGARTLLVISVDSNGDKAAHTITLTGTTAVSVPRTNVVAIEYMEVLTAGSGFANAGLIAAIANGTTLMTMLATANTTQTGVHYTPSGMKCYIYNLAASTKGNSIYIDLYKSAYMATGVKMIQLLPSMRCTTTGTASVSVNFSTPFVISNSSGMPMKIEMYVNADSNTAATINSSFTFIDR
jgi:hypothetical protein